MRVISIGMLAVVAVILAINALFGFKRGIWRGLLRLITTLLAAAGAFAATKGLGKLAAERIEPALEEMLAANPDVVAFLSRNPSVGASAGALAQMLASPILFLVCYILLKMVSWLIYCILRAVLHIPKPKKGWRKWTGLVTGLAMGLVGITVLVTPVFGYTHLVADIFEETESLVDSSTATALKRDMIDPITQTAVASHMYDLAGSKLFDALTTVEWDGDKVSLRSEWFAVIGVVDNGMTLGKRPVAEYGATESRVIHEMASGIGESHLLSGLGGGALNGLSNAWLEGQPFFGVSKPNTGDESIDLILTGFLRVLSSADPATISEDLGCFADLFDLFIEYDIFGKIGGEDKDALMVQLATSGFLDEARALLKSYERMEPVTKAISDAGMHLLVRELGDPAKYLEEYGPLMNDMSVVLKGAVDDNGNVSVDKVTENLNATFAEHSISVPADATPILAEGLVDEFTAEELETLSPEEIMDRMIERFGNVDNIDQYKDMIPQ